MFGLFLCSDFNRSGSCQGKKEFDFSSSLKKIKPNSKESVFAFHKMLVDKKYIGVFTSDVGNKNQRSERFLKRRLKTFDGKHLARANRYSRQLKNIPLAKRDGSVVMTMTQSDLSCLKQPVARRYRYANH